MGISGMFKFFLKMLNYENRDFIAKALGSFCVFTHGPDLEKASEDMRKALDEAPEYVWCWLDVLMRYTAAEPETKSIKLRSRGKLKLGIPVVFAVGAFAPHLMMIESTQNLLVGLVPGGRLEFLPNSRFAW